MAIWKDITDAALEPGKPIRSVDGLALRDNVTALAEGAAGAPKIQNAAMGTNSVDNANVVNSNIGAEKFQTGTTERDWVLGRTSDAGAGAVGTYGFFLKTSSGTSSPGSTISGSSLSWSNGGGNNSGSPSGTWRCMGFVPIFGSDAERSTSWLRIS